MGKHKGQGKRKWDDAVDSAAAKALQDGGPGKYALDEVIVNVGQAQAGAAPGTNPIRDYVVTLDGPR